MSDDPIADESQEQRRAMFLHTCNPAKYPLPRQACGKAFGIHRCYRASNHANECCCYCGERHGA